MLNCTQTRYEKVTVELSAEEVVTKLLTSNQILKQQKGNFYIDNPLVDTLGDFLLEIEPEINSPSLPEQEDIKYRFIKY